MLSTFGRPALLSNERPHLPSTPSRLIAELDPDALITAAREEIDTRGLGQGLSISSVSKLGKLKVNSSSVAREARDRQRASELRETVVDLLLYIVFMIIFTAATTRGLQSSHSYEVS